MPAGTPGFTTTACNMLCGFYGRSRLPGDTRESRRLMRAFPASVRLPLLLGRERNASMATPLRFKQAEELL